MDSLGLDVHGVIPASTESQPSDSTQSNTSSHLHGRDDMNDGEKTFESSKQEDKTKKDKGKPYVPVTPAARAKMTPEQLAERMEKIRLQNEKIKERREHVKADEEAFNTSVAADRAKQAANRKIQAQINQNREQNAKRKMEKMENREWDSGKHGGEWKQGKRPVEDNGRGNSFSPPTAGPDPRGLRAAPSKRNASGTPPSKHRLPPREIAPHIVQLDTAPSHPDIQAEIKEND